MANDPQNMTAAELAQQRLNELLELLAQQGFTQQAVAARTNLPPQYLSDLKCGQRNLTELVARRIAEEFDLDYQWLLGTGSTPKRPTIAAPSTGGGVWLPILSHPVEGNPKETAVWDGTGVEIAGSAVAKLVHAILPYVLRFGHDDIRGRLCKKDLILISQDVPKQAGIFVVRYRKKAFLARRQEDGTWERVANGATLPKTSAIIGHCLGIVWSSL